jgi:hypothetical protein
MSYVRVCINTNHVHGWRVVCVYIIYIDLQCIAKRKNKLVEKKQLNGCGIFVLAERRTNGLCDFLRL